MHKTLCTMQTSPTPADDELNARSFAYRFQPQLVSLALARLQYHQIAREANHTERWLLRSHDYALLVCVERLPSTANKHKSDYNRIKYTGSHVVAINDFFLIRPTAATASRSKILARGGHGVCIAVLTFNNGAMCDLTTMSCPIHPTYATGSLLAMDSVEDADALEDILTDVIRQKGGIM